MMISFKKDVYSQTIRYPRNSENLCFISFFRVQFRVRGPTSGSFVYAKPPSSRRPAASGAPKTDYAQKPETQAFSSYALQRTAWNLLQRYSLDI